jgi:hypothetical protein
MPDNVINLATFGDVEKLRAVGKSVKLGVIYGVIRNVGKRTQLIGEGTRVFYHLIGSFVVEPSNGKSFQVMKGLLFLPDDLHKQLADATAKHEGAGIIFAIELEVNGLKTSGRFLLPPAAFDPLSSVKAALSKGKK